MPSIKMMRSKISSVDTRKVKPAIVADRRINGRAGVERRFRIWNKTRCCASCGRLVSYRPDTFELDHVVELADGGSEDDENLQILCIYFDENGKQGCHVEKTNEMKRQRAGG